MKKYAILLACVALLGLVGCAKGTTIQKDDKQNSTEINQGNQTQQVEIPEQRDYGVFLNEEMSAIPKMADYEIVVVEGQSFTKEAVAELKQSGKRMCSYLNVGSIETWRDYYSDYQDLAGKVYENWEDEYWVDVTDARWQDLILKELAPSLKEKGFDGLFLDNLDVYYINQEDEVFDALVMILKELKAQGFYIMINGGDTFVEEYANRYYKLKDIMDAVNQETVFSSIDFETETFGRHDEEEKNYFEEYCELVKSYDCDVYLLEYTTDVELINEIKAFCEENEYYYFISDKINI